MSGDCCGHGATFEGLSADYKRRLWLVIAINASMFLVEMAAGALAGSQALQADALDFLGDATTYGISLAVIGASIQIRARAAMLKALSLTAMALWVLGSTAHHVLILGVPRAEVMGVIGILALAANAASVLILMLTRMVMPMCVPFGCVLGTTPLEMLPSCLLPWRCGAPPRDGQTY